MMNNKKIININSWLEELRSVYSFKENPIITGNDKISVIPKSSNKLPHKIDIFISILICISAILIAAETFSDVYLKYSSMFWWAEVIIIIFFLFEMIIKMIAQEKCFLNYFRIGWNKFDFIIIIISIVPFVLPNEENIKAFEILRLLRLFRAFRALRVLELFSHNDALELLIETFKRSMPHFSYITLFFGMVVYIYGVIGCFMFGQFDPQHFNNISRSIITLFGCLSGTWVDIMEKNMANSDFDLIFVPFYFISFYLIGATIVIQFFTGAIVESMNKARVEVEYNKISIESKKLVDLELTEIKMLEDVEKKLNELKIQIGSSRKE